MTRNTKIKISLFILALFAITIIITEPLLLTLSRYYISRNFGIQIHSEQLDIHPLSRSLSLQLIQVHRDIPNFLDIQAKNLHFNIKTKTLDIQILEGRIISQNIAIPFNFDRILMSPIRPNHLVNDLFFNSTIEGSIWESDVAITPQGFNLSFIPIDKINTLFDNALVLFSKGDLGIKTLSPWEKDGTLYTTQLQISVRNFKTRMPDGISGFQKIIVKQLLTYLKQKGTLLIDIPFQINPTHFNGQSAHDFDYVFKQLGLSLSKTVPRMFFKVNDAQLRTIENSLLGLLDD